MIISHKHKFIFLKTIKTAGTSIEISLSRYCGKDDIITPIVPEDEEIRKNLNKHPQNYFAPIYRYGLLDFKKLILNGQRKMRFWNHAPAFYVKKQVGDKIWNSYYKFCFERNPWDKQVSMYFWDKGKTDIFKDMSFREYLHCEPFEKISPFNFPSKPFNRISPFNFPIYTHKGSLLVDFVGKYEKLENDLKIVCRKVGIDFDGWLPHAKGDLRRNKQHYSTYYDEEGIELIRNLFKQEIQLFGYNFERI